MSVPNGNLDTISKMNIYYQVAFEAHLGCFSKRLLLMIRHYKTFNRLEGEESKNYF